MNCIYLWHAWTLWTFIIFCAPCMLNWLHSMTVHNALDCCKIRISEQSLHVALQISWTLHDIHNEVPDTYRSMYTIVILISYTTISMYTRWGSCYHTYRNILVYNNYTPLLVCNCARMVSCYCTCRLQWRHTTVLSAYYVHIYWGLYHPHTCS